LRSDVCACASVFKIFNFKSSTRPGENFSLSFGGGNCYKVRVPIDCGHTLVAVALDTPSKREKALAGTASPVSATTGLCTISLSEWMPATL
jgi:hypothetical protein